MRYSGDTYQISCAAGGLTANPNIDVIRPPDMIHPTRNLNLDENGRRKRGGTAHVMGSAFSSTPEIMGIYDFRLRNGNDFVMAGCDDGKLYRDTTELKTGMSTTDYFSFVTFENELFVCDKDTVPQTWNGVAGSTSDITSPASDWTSNSSWPQQMVKHGRGVSERLWAIGCASTPYRVYASANGDGQDFGDTNVVTIDIETGDGFGIIGAVEYGDRLFCFGKRKVYVIDDLDSDTSNWGYDDAQWEGGVANFRLLVKTPNDIIAMMEDGEVYSVTSAQTYGDYKLASLTKDSFMHKWIKRYVNLSAFAKFHSVYDPTLRAIKIFVVRSGQTDIDTALVYFIDREPREAWMVHSNQSSTSGYSASCSAVIRVGAGNYQVYTGGYLGHLWKLEQANRNDNNNAYYAGFKTPNVTFDNPRVTKKFGAGWLVTEPKGDYNLIIDTWIDGVPQTQRTVSLGGAGGTLPFTLGTDLLGGQDLVDKDFDIRNIGKRIQFEVYNSTVNQDFYVSQILIDHVMIGPRAGL